MKKKLLFALVALSTTCSVRADVIWQETFNYANGNITNTSSGVWINHSGGGGSAAALVNNKRLEVSSTSGGNGLAPGRADDDHRNLALAVGSPYTNGLQVMYASFIVNFTNIPSANGAYVAHFQNGNSTFFGRLWALAGNPAQTTNNFSALPKTFRLGITTTNSGGPTTKILGVDLALNTDYQVVMGYDPITLFGTTLWVNPIDSTTPGVISGDAFNPNATTSVAQSFSFRQASGFGGFLTVTNLVLATTFDEAFTNALSTNAVAPKMVYQPIVGVTNFVGSTFNLAAVAAGQGLASLTYQWYKDAATYANPAGNTNVLNLANAQISDSGDYKLVATTPYGLSVTSSVSKVLISAAPVPPTFLTQPVSQTLYRGQNLNLTTTVSSPGNCTFTWFSNNVAVATTGPDNSGASSFQINNLVTNNSATYKVAVTNDVVANGIVSTNAVVTVINPPKVSIAYLRTLVDPNNFYQPTNSSQPYEATGVITTYTNLTTGDTSSYYLQDATAGINIFATFGSTFRPARGDVVTFVGVLSNFSSGLELAADTVTKTYTSYSIVSNGFALPTPLSIPFTVTNTFGYAYMNTNIAGRLVQLTDVYFGSNAGSNIVAGFIGVTNGLGQPFRLWFPGPDLDVIGQTLPAYASSVTGVMFGGMNAGAPNFAVAVTKFSDIVTAVNPIPLTLSFSAGTLTFTWADATFNLQSASIVTGPYSTITGAVSGFTTNSTSDQQYFRLIHP